MRKKILFILPTVDGFGAERSIAPIIEKLDTTTDVKVVVPRKGKLESFLKLDEDRFLILPLFKFTRKTQIPFFKRWLFPFLKRNLTICTLLYLKYFKRVKFDVAYVNTLTHYLGLYLRRYGIADKVVFHCREHYSKQFSRKLEVNEDVILKNADLLLFNSEITKSQFQDINVPNMVVPNPIIKDVKCKSRQGRKLTRKALFIGRFDDSKKPLDAIRIVSEHNLKNTSNKISLSIYGSGFQDEHIVEQIADIDEIELKGFIDLDQVDFDAYDFALLPYKYEAFGRIYIELLNYSVPILSTNSGNAVYLLDDGKNALFFNDGETEDAMNKIDLLYKLELHNAVNSPSDIVTKTKVSKFLHSSVISEYESILNGFLND